MNLNDWSIRSKSIVILGTLSALILLMGILSYYLIAATNQSTEEIGDSWLPSVRVAGEIQTAAARLRTTSARIAMAETKDDLEAGIATNGSMMKTLTDLVALYERDLVYDEQDRANLAVVKEQIKSVQQINASIAEPAKLGKREEAIHAWLATGAKFAEFIKATENFKQFNVNGANNNVEKSKRAFHLTVVIILSCSAASIVIAFFSYAIMNNTLSRPLRSITATMRRLAEHDLDIIIAESGRADEIGEMATALEVFRDNIISADKLRKLQAAEQEKRLNRTQHIEKLVADFHRSISEAISLVTDSTLTLDSTARSMSVTAQGTTQQVAAAATAAQEASTNVQTVATAAEQLSSSINEIGRQVAESSKFTDQATRQARDTESQINHLNDSAQKIGDVVQLINDIASQTNLLALNATIEAARAGEAGKGFAVVANEVKMLANQTARATEEISAKVAEMQSATSESVTAVSAISQTIARIAEIAAGIASAVNEQNAATEEIARNVQQAAQRTEELSHSVVYVKRGAADTGEASNQVLGAANSLGENADVMRNQVEGFIGKIRSA